MIDGDPFSSASPAYLQRAGYLAVLRILASQRQQDLDDLAVEADALACRGFILDNGDASARLDHVREHRRLTTRLAVAAAELQAATRALREAILDDGWTPSDDPDGRRARNGRQSPMSG